MLFVDYNSSIRDIFKQVEGVSQHGLEELFDDEVIAGRHSYAESIITAGLASKEDILNLPYFFQQSIYNHESYVLPLQE